jgi:hypothetical protein
MQETFRMIPAGNGMLWLVGVVAVMLVGVLALLGWLALSSKRVELAVEPGVLVIRGGPYGRRLSLADLDLERARPVDLTAERELQARWKTNGAALPGLQQGWFRLRNKGKVLLFVTDRTRVLHVPTTDGWDLQVSVEHPEALLAALRKARL